MIVRILTEGQYNISSSYIDELNEVDNHLVAAEELFVGEGLLPG